MDLLNCKECKAIKKDIIKHMNKNNLPDCSCDLQHLTKAELLWLGVQDNKLFFKEFFENEEVHNHVDLDVRMFVKTHFNKSHLDEINIANPKLDDFDKAIINTQKSVGITTIKSKELIKQ